MFYYCFQYQLMVLPEHGCDNVQINLNLLSESQKLSKLMSLAVQPKSFIVICWEDFHYQTVVFFNIQDIETNRNLTQDSLKKLKI